ncbi:nucleotide-diphospho-sugar transferase [Micractinium conductrix]|uniref:Nucleotide-diphospho-sugar transferase n=1 Tax=Micractinium conductrix TaxID=554055 RepID=A0A2P6VF86_9CHLO|nr:nucleotide-diphospho-sugar transferase [Micractinium conductrix]|eukprot:PSC72756.1 nucleotide-diphospho-sugar transferase [Micractinium conductrix]
MRVPRVAAFFSRTREGQLLSRELRDLPPKQAFCLAALPALHQAHVLSLVPTSLPVTQALEKLGAALARVEDFYDSIGGLAGYQAQCLALISQQREQGLARPPHGAATGSSSSSTSSMESLASTDPAWPEGFSPAAPGSSAAADTEYLIPVGLDLDSPCQAGAAAAAVAAGIDALPHMAEIYPLGGAGDRLGLRCERTGESLPTAVLQYCGRSLLENLLRDLQAREYLHWQLRGVQHTTPIAIMTSAAKGNHWRVAQLFDEAGWFGRGASSFRLFQQPLVPMVGAEDGRWLLQRPLEVMMKPGGHGVIWKLMIDTGVFDWLAGQGRQAAIVRQISNPMAGMDTTLLALAGAGYPGRRSFGFASCERVVGAAEGMNVLAQQRRPAGTPPEQHGSDGGGGASRAASAGAAQHVRRDHSGASWAYRVTNVEYTEFERLGLADESVDEASNVSVFPANTNVLYVGLPAVERTVRASMAAGSTDAVLPGMILNLSKKVTWSDPLAGGADRAQAAARLECTMQNLADCLAQSFPQPLESDEGKAELDTFLVYNQRRKVTSSAKRKLSPGSTRVHQTPDGSFYDLQRNAHDLLSNHCGMAVAQVGSVAEYLAYGPGFVFLAHPALGPLWSVIGQKIRGGSLAPRSELQLEVAEACVQELHVEGSLLVVADSPLGHTEQHAAPAGRANSGAALLDSLLSPTSSSSGGGGGGGGGGGLASSLAGGVGGYSQPCSPTPACDAGEAEARLVYSQRCGRLRLHNVRVMNVGVEWAHPDNVWWRHSLVRREACRITLHGNSEFEARGVTLSGNLHYVVPAGHRMLVTASHDGAPHVEVHPLAGGQPTWRWRYSQGSDGQVALELAEGSSCAAAAPSA